MKKELGTIVFVGLFAMTTTTTLHAKCDISDGVGVYSECIKTEMENARRNAMSYEEREVEDLEKENELKQRKKEAQAEKERLEYKEKSTYEKAKSWFN